MMELETRGGRDGEVVAVVTDSGRRVKKGLSVMRVPSVQ
jgi:hypothetical protein